MQGADHPSCFADLEIVFPMGADGLRRTPPACMQCAVKTDCLRAAMDKPSALVVQEEMIDRAYQGGVIGALQRWSRKKTIHRRKQS